MSYKVDYPPLEYLQRRIKYYKKRKARVKRLPDDEFFVRKYGARKIKKISNDATLNIEKMIKEFEKAISILKNHQNDT